MLSVIIEEQRLRATLAFVRFVSCAGCVKLLKRAFGVEMEDWPVQLERCMLDPAARGEFMRALNQPAAGEAAR